MKISIIVPIYNCEKYIDNCIRSLLNQTYSNIEILLINDGSTDKSLEIIKKYKDNNKVKIYSQKNSGANKARNYGVKKSTGDYIMFVDSDDWIDNNTIEMLVNYLKRYEVDIIKFSMILEPSKKIRNIFDENELLIEKEQFAILYNMFLKTYKLNSICACLIRAKLFNKDYKSLHSKSSFAEDYMLNIELINYSDSFLFVNKPLYHYRLNYNSTTKKLDFNRIIENIKDAYEAYSFLFLFKENWNLSETDVEFRLYKEICYEFSKLSLCNNISKNDFKNIILEFIEKTNLHKKICHLSISNIKSEFKELPLTDRIQYYLFAKYLFQKKYNLAINSLFVFKLKERIRRIKNMKGHIYGNSVFSK